MRMLKAFAYLGDGTAGWVEKPIPQPTGFDGVIRPLLVSPCTSDVHNVEIDCLKPGRILGHEGLGEIVAVGEDVKEFQVGELVGRAAVTPDWRTVPSQLGRTSTAPDSSPAKSSPTPRTASWLSMPSSGISTPTPPTSPRRFTGRGRHGGGHAEHGLYGAELAEVPAGRHRRGHGRWPRGLMAIAGARLRGPADIAIGSRRPASSWPSSMGPRTS